MNLRLANEAWESLLRTHTLLMRKYREDNIWGDLTMTEYDVLYTLAKSAHPLRLSEILEGVLLSQPAISRLVDRMVTKGLVARAENCDDRRALHITLTEKGAALQKQVGRAHAKQIAAALADVEKQELETLRDICNSIIKSHMKP